MAPAVPTPLPAAVPAPPAARLDPVPAPATPTPSAATAVTAPAERQARCIEILQKASLEPISAAETEFFKKECR